VDDISNNLRQAFIVYLISHDRPMSEVLAPTLKNIEPAFKHGFAGMTRESVEHSDLLAARAALIKSIVGDMPADHRNFLVSFERGAPKWDLLGLPEAAKLPAVLWRQQNLDKLGRTAPPIYPDLICGRHSSGGGRKRSVPSAPDHRPHRDYADIVAFIRTCDRGASLRAFGACALPPKVRVARRHQPSSRK
jgi:hypothetical protein